MPFDDVLGHAAAISRLAAAAADGALTHAILFTGPEGVGKTTAAVHLAEHLLQAQAWPGGINAHPDFWLEDSDVENISIERVRPGGQQAPTLQDFLALRPYAGSTRVAVVGRAERLTEQAANCLLKTIEEPPYGTHLLLCAAHFERLPATVLSRCEVVVLAPVATPLITTWLRDAHGVAPATATLAAPLAAGRPGRALALATEAGALNAEVAAVDMFVAAGGGGISAALQTAAALAPGGGAEGRERVLVMLAAWAAFVRDVACYSAGAPELALWTPYRTALERWAEDLPAARVVAILDRIVRASESVAQYAQPRLALEALLVDIFGGADSPPAVDAVRPELAATPSGGAEGGTRRRPPSARRGRATDAGSR